MMKIRFVACLIGAVLLLSSFDVQKCADALQKAYEENDYDAFVAAFPDKFENMLEVYGYDYINGKKFYMITIVSILNSYSLMKG